MWEDRSFDLSYTFTRRICGLGWIGRDDGHGAGGSPDKPFCRTPMGFLSLHHQGKYDVDGRGYAYSNAEPEIGQVLADNPTIQVVIDHIEMVWGMMSIW